MLDALFLNLGQHDIVSSEEKTLLAAAISQGRQFSTGQDIVISGSRPTYSSLLVEGLVRDEIER